MIAGLSAVSAFPVGNILGCLLVVFSTIDYRALSPSFKKLVGMLFRLQSRIFAT